MSLSTLEITQMRADADAYLPDTCVLQSVTRTADSVGGWAESWAAADTVQCRVAPMPLNRPETINAAQMASESRWVLTVAYNLSIDVTQRVVHASTTYEIESLEDTHSNRTAKRAYLRRID